MWIYEQSTGKLSQNGELATVGYSGYLGGKNNPKFQSAIGIGPIPQGDWDIVGPPFYSSEHGPYVLSLLPMRGTETFGRSAFLIHGDSLQHPGQASRGCVIVPHNIRESIWLSGDHTLRVVA